MRFMKRVTIHKIRILGSAQCLHRDLVYFTNRWQFEKEGHLGTSTGKKILYFE